MYDNIKVDSMRGEIVEDTNSKLKYHINIKKLLTIMIAVIVVIVSFLLSTKNADFKVQQPIPEKIEAKSLEVPKEIKKEEKTQKEQVITGLIIGLDESKVLTDVVMVVHFNPTSKTVKLISIPRDFYVNFEEPRFSSIKEKNPKLNANYSKLTEMYNRIVRIADQDEAVKTVKAIAEEIVGFPIDYYVKIDLEGFKAVIDMVGGVEVELPDGSLETLDSKKAEELVRNRYGHADGDFGRIRMQQLVIKSLTKKIMGMKNPVDIFKVIKEGYQYIQTDFRLFDGIKYIQYLSEVQMETVFQNEDMVIIPTRGEKIDGIWYEMQDKEKTKEILDKLFGL